MLKIWIAAFFSITALGLVSCQGGVSGAEEKNGAADGSNLMDGFPFKIESVAAYNGPSYISVYFSGPSDVVAVTFDKSGTCGSDSPVQLIEKPGGTLYRGVTHFSGDNIANYVLPKGAVPPFPADYDYTQKQAVSVLMSCKILPSEDLDTQLYSRFIFSMTDISFEDGLRFAIEPMELIAGIFPP